MGWYGFNPGSTLGLTNDRDLLAAKTAHNTTMGAVGGGLVALAWHVLWREEEGIGAVMGRKASVRGYGCEDP